MYRHPSGKLTFYACGIFLIDLGNADDGGMVITTARENLKEGNREQVDANVQGRVKQIVGSSLKDLPKLRQVMLHGIFVDNIVLICAHAHL